MGDVLLQGFDVGSGAVHQHDEVVGIADDPPGWQPELTTPMPLIGGAHLRARLPRRHHVLIEHAKRDVGQQRGQDASLRGAGVGLLEIAGLCHDPGLQEGLHQRHDAFVLHPCPDPVQQDGVIDHVEARLDVGVQHPVVALGAEAVDVGHGVMSPPLRSEPIRDRQEVGLEDRLQHQLQRRLDHPVRDRGNAEFAQLPRPARFRNHPLTHRQRPERPRLQLGAEIVQEPLDPEMIFDGSRRSSRQCPPSSHPGCPRPGRTPSTASPGHTRD